MISAHSRRPEQLSGPNPQSCRASAIASQLEQHALTSERTGGSTTDIIQCVPFAAGDRLGPYEIMALAGKGGMGEVYRARDTRLGRDVAVKVLAEHLSKNPHALARFVRETKAVAALSHPNILSIFDTGTENGATYAVTELLEGETLRVRLNGGPLAWRKAVEIAAALAEGVAAAHSKGITHRDLKPENIFLTSDGRVKILDFGLASVEQPLCPEAETRTETGMVIGTPGYMSPEQVRGQAAGPTSDIFSLGCVFYEMVSGQRAFHGATSAETASSILRDSPRDLQETCALVPPELDRLIVHCLEKNPEERFQAARDLAFHLRAILNSSPAPAAGPASNALDSIAVLPFTNPSRDPDTEYLCDGITESILNTLTRIAQLRVTPRSTVFRYKTGDPDPLLVGRELNVRVVLTGRLIQRGATLVVGAELVDVAAGSQLWGERYNRKMSDIFELEEEIARKISDSLRMKLTGEEKRGLAKRFTENAEAYQLYLRGRHHWIRRTPNHLKKGVEYFQQAIEKDPAYALAYSGLADCHSILALFSVVSPKEGFARAKAAGAAAVALDQDLAEGHTSLGFIQAYFDWDWAAADARFQGASRVNPGYWVTPYWYAFTLMSRGRHAEAEQQIQHALRLEPLSATVLHAASLASLVSGRYSEAEERCFRGLEYDSTYFHLRMWLGLVYQCRGKFAEAIVELEQARDLSGGVPTVVGALGSCHGAGRNLEAAAIILGELLGRCEREHTCYYQIALIYAGLGDHENALLWLENACDAHDGFLTMLVKVDPRLQALHEEPRYQSVLKRLKLT